MVFLQAEFISAMKTVQNPTAFMKTFDKISPNLFLANKTKLF